MKKLCLKTTNRLERSGGTESEKHTRFGLFIGKAQIQNIASLVL